MEILVVHTPTNTVVRETVEVTDTLAPRFDWNTSTTTTLDTVEFDAAESRYEEGTITNYEWEILDGSENFATNTGEQVTHSFSDPGTYQVRLTIQTDDGRSATRTKTIEAFSPPAQAAFTYDPTNPDSEEQVTFNASDSEAPDGNITSYSWDFGDGNTSTGEEVNHTYANPGTYTVTLTVTDDDGRTVSKARGIAVGEQEPFFDVTIDDVSRDVVDGETVTLRYTIENTGDATDTQDVLFKVNGTQEATNASVELDGGNSTSGTFTYKTDKTNIPAIKVNVSSDNDFETETVDVSPRIRIFNAQPQGAENSEVTFRVENQAGEEVTIDAITLNSTSSNADRVNNGGSDELTFSGAGRLDAGKGNAGINVDGTHYALNTVESVTSGDTTIAELIEFETNGKTTIDMSGETLTVTLYLSDGRKYTETLTIESKPYYEIEITGTNGPVEEGGELQVDYNVTNLGSEPGDQDIRLEFDGNEVSVDQDVALNPGDSEQGTLTYSLGSESPDKYDVAVLTDNETDDTTVEVIQSDVPYFEVNITGTNAPVSEGENLEVTAEITNVGNVSGTQTVALDISDGVGKVASKELKIDPEQTVQETFTWSTGNGDAGDYDATVSSNNSTDAASVSVKDGPFFLGLTAEVTDSRGGGTEAEEVTVEYNLSENVGDVTITIQDNIGQSATADGTDTPTTGGTLHTVALAFGGGGQPVDNYPVVVTVDIQGGECYTVELSSASDRATLASSDWETC